MMRPVSQRKVRWWSLILLALCLAGALRSDDPPPDQDSDNDDMPDVWESAHGLDPQNPDDGRPDADADGDGLSNVNEYWADTDPQAFDSDGDTMGDGWEATYGLNPKDHSDGESEWDNDNLTAMWEHYVGTDPTNPDTDGNGIPDGWDYWSGGTLSYLTMDYDRDGMPDLWEWQHGLNPRSDADKWSDPDGDELPNLMEYLNGRNPQNSSDWTDTDGDWLADDVELWWGQAGWGAGVLDVWEGYYDEENVLPGMSGLPGWLEVIAVARGWVGLDGSTWPTTPLWDSDGNGVCDLLEDVDGDGLPGWWERFRGLDPSGFDDDGDWDGNGLSLVQEYLATDSPWYFAAPRLLQIAAEAGVTLPASLQVVWEPLRIDPVDTAPPSVTPNGILLETRLAEVFQVSAGYPAPFWSPSGLVYRHFYSDHVWWDESNGVTFLGNSYTEDLTLPWASRTGPAAGETTYVEARTWHADAQYWECFSSYYSHPYSTNQLLADTLATLKRATYPDHWSTNVPVLSAMSLTRPDLPTYDANTNRLGDRPACAARKLKVRFTIGPWWPRDTLGVSLPLIWFPDGSAPPVTNFLYFSKEDLAANRTFEIIPRPDGDHSFAARSVRRATCTIQPRQGGCYEMGSPDFVRSSDRSIVDGLTPGAARTLSSGAAFPGPVPPAVPPSATPPNPAGASPPSGGTEAGEEPPGEDGDGVPAEMDDFPGDPERAVARPLHYAVIALGTNTAPLRVTTNGWVLLPDSHLSNNIAGYRWHAGTLETLIAIEKLTPPSGTGDKVTMTASVHDIDGAGTVTGRASEAHAGRQSYHFTVLASSPGFTPPATNWPPQVAPSPSYPYKAAVWSATAAQPTLLTTRECLNYGEQDQPRDDQNPDSSAPWVSWLAQWFQTTWASNGRFLSDVGNVEGEHGFPGPLKPGTSDLPPLTGRFQEYHVTNYHTVAIWSVGGSPQARFEDYKEWQYALIDKRGAHSLYQGVPIPTAPGTPTDDETVYLVDDTELPFRPSFVNTAGAVLGVRPGNAAGNETWLRDTNGSYAVLDDLWYIQGQDATGGVACAKATILPGRMNAQRDILNGTTLWTTNHAIHGFTNAPAGSYQPVWINELVDTRWTITAATDLSDTGLIVGLAHTNGGQDTAVLLYPLGLLTDGNRDGVLSGADRLSQTNVTQTNGALFSVNCDRDGNTSGDADLVTFNDDGTLTVSEDPSIKGGGDIDDITPIRLTGGQLPPGWRAVLRAKDSRMLRGVLVYTNRCVGQLPEWGRDANNTTTEFDISELLRGSGITTNDLGIAGLLFKGMTNLVLGQPTERYDGRFEAELGIYVGDDYVPVEHIAMHVTPWLMLPNSAKSEVLFTYEEANYNEAFVAGLSTVAASTGTPLDRVTEDGAAWVQDHAEIGYCQRPGGPFTWMTFRLPYGNQPDWPVQKLLGQNRGVFQLGKVVDEDPTSSGPDPQSESGDFGGNLEVTSASSTWPLGRVLAGDRMGPGMREFLEKQCLATNAALQLGVTDVATTWLDVGHVDEMLGFTGRVVDGANEVIIASPQRLYDVIRATVPSNQWASTLLFTTGSVTTGLADGKGLSGTTQQLVLTITNLSTAVNPAWRFLRIYQGAAKGCVARLKLNTSGQFAIISNRVEITEVWHTGTNIVDETEASYFRRGIDNKALWGTNWSDVHAVPGPSSKIVLFADTLTWDETEMPAALTVQELMTDAGLAFVNVATETETAATRLDQARASLTSQAGPAHFTEVPAVYGGLQKTKGFGELSAGALIPGLANFQVVGTSLVFPKPYGPRVNGADVLEQAVIEAVPNAVFVDDWNPYHSLKGEVHCGTSVRRAQPETTGKPTLWWETLKP